MLTAITRAVSPAIVHCELSFIDRQPIDLATAQEQHHAYEQLLGKLGARVISLPPEPTLPDSMFVEDPAIVLDELAVILPLGTETRRREAQSLAQPLSRFRKLEYVSLTGTLEGGDLLRTRARIESRGFSVTSIDISELQKAESGLTCSSLLFEAKNSDSR